MEYNIENNLKMHTKKEAT